LVDPFCSVALRLIENEKVAVGLLNLNELAEFHVYSRAERLFMRLLVQSTPADARDLETDELLLISSE
jgi:hypothetical protein